MSIRVDLAELQQHAAATMWRVFAGFACGVAAGTLLGALAGYSVMLLRIVDPTLQALRSIPSIAWVPLFILWFGIFEASKIILIAVGVFFPVYLGVMGAVISVDRKIVEVGRVFRLSGFAMIRRILLPAVLPAYVISLRAGLGLGWMFVVAAEFLGASTGLGFLLIDGQQLGKPAFLERPYFGSPAAPAQAETNASQIWGHINSGFLIGYEYTRWWKESLALRQAAVIGDWSWLNKTRVRGRDAAKLMAYAAIRDLSAQQVGQIVHTPMLSEQGKVAIEGLTLKLGDDEYLFTQSASYRWLDFLRRMTAGVSPNERAAFFAGTAQRTYGVD